MSRHRRNFRLASIKYRKEDLMHKVRSGSWNTSKFPEIGRGGEAAVYKLPKGLVAKIFHSAIAPEYKNRPDLQEAARVRIAEMQKKLLEIPERLPGELVVPQAVLITPKNNVFGYMMPYVQGTPFSELTKSDSTLSQTQKLELLASLYDTIEKCHACGIVIGDNNENNIIVEQIGNTLIPRYIDMDAMQWGNYICRSFMPRFVAPEVIRAEYATPASDTTVRDTDVQYKMVRPHTELTDWYSFLVLAMRLLTFTEPYGGTLEGYNLARRITERITVFDRRVVYPQIARPMTDIPRPLLETFFKVFYRHDRFKPDRDIFDNERKGNYAKVK